MCSIETHFLSYKPPRYVFINKKSQGTCPWLRIPWSGRRESNPRCKLGKLKFYH